MTNTNTKFTKAMNYAKLVEIINASNETTEEKDRLIKFCMHETELIEKKKASKSETAQDKANLSTMDFILEALATAPNGMTITELTKTPKIAEIEGNSIHRISALVTKLKNINKVIRTEVKGVARFSLVTEAEETEESGE